MNDHQIDICWKLLDKSSSRRMSYASRASIILATDTIFTGIFVFFIKDGGERRLALLLSLLGLALLVTSTIFSLMATMNVFLWRNSREVVDYPPEAYDRLFISPKDTFKRLPRFKDFAQAVRSLPKEQLLRVLEGELYIDLRLQKKRYRNLQLSSMCLVSAAFLVLTVAILQGVASLMTP
ncbi:MAG TPA: hypothetical protein VOA87_20400 [Thermoanaerobaculia bacterium]|nr:hypothetical protein [Thermoanaerobaculia bacterium]